MFEVIYNVGEKYPETMDYNEGNMKETCERVHKTVKEVIYVVIFVQIMVARARCFLVF